MAKFHPPSEFKFDRPADWPEWKQRFSRYRLATKLSKDNGDIQVSSLIYAMGSEAENIFSSFSFINEDEKKSYDVVLKKFDEYFIPRRNVIRERACFYQRGQQPEETAEQYIRVLYELAGLCEFGNKQDEHIRDRLVVGIQDKDLSRKLQLKADLTLPEAIEQVRQAEKIKQVDLQSSALEGIAVNLVRRQRGPYTDRPGRHRPFQDVGSRQGSHQMRDFSREYDFAHVTSSPQFPQTKRHGEQAVQVAKTILRQDDPLLALMAYRATPNSSTGTSPAELPMGRRLRITLPVLQDNLKPSCPDLDKIQGVDESHKQKQAHFYNRRNGVRCLPPFSPGGPVLMKLDGQKQWTRPAVVQSPSSTPRSCMVETAQGECYRRNSPHLLAIPPGATTENGDPVATSKTEDSEIINEESPASATLETFTLWPRVTLTRSGRLSKPAAKLDL